MIESAPQLSSADDPWSPEGAELAQLRRIAESTAEERVRWVEEMLYLAFEMGWAEPVRPVNEATWERWRVHGRPPGDWRTAHDPWPPEPSEERG